MPTVGYSLQNREILTCLLFSFCAIFSLNENQLFFYRFNFLYLHIDFIIMAGNGYADMPGNAGFSDGQAHVRAAPDVQHHSAQENVVVNPDVVDVHAANAAGQHVHTGWYVANFDFQHLP